MIVLCDVFFMNYLDIKYYKKIRFKYSNLMLITELAGHWKIIELALKNYNKLITEK